MTPRSAHPIPGYETLLRRVEEARGPDQELAHDIARALFQDTDAKDWPGIATLPYLALGNGHEAIGAALVLVERKLPGWQMWLSNIGRGDYWQAQVEQAATGKGRVTMDAPTAPLAMLAVLLSALSALPPIDEKPEAQAGAAP